MNHWHHHRLVVETTGSFRCHDITAELKQVVERCGIESGLLADIERFFLELAPADRPWMHNDLHLRQGIPPDEPRNAHSHLIALMLGNHLSLPVTAGRLALGTYQAVLLVELDGPRQREVLLQLSGVQPTERAG